MNDSHRRTEGKILLTDDTSEIDPFRYDFEISMRTAAACAMFQVAHGKALPQQVRNDIVKKAREVSS